MVKHSSRIELNQVAYKGNINFIRKKIGDKPILSSVVKANAYGHGIEAFVPMAERCGINHFSVASSFEAEQVLSVCSAESQVLIMGIIYEEDLGWAISNGISFFVYNFNRLAKVLEAAKKVGKQALVHLEVETGANRTGMHAQEFPKALAFLKQHAEWLKFEGLCTHFGGAESVSNQFKIDRQHKRYKGFLKTCKDKKMMPEIRHIACSAAALAMKDTVYDMVRIGVAQYGFWPSPDIYYAHLHQTNKSSDSTMKRVFNWKTDIMDIRTVEQGEFIGYGTAFQATQNMRIAVLPLGYSNGYPRALSNRGQVLIKGKKAPIVGLINMNLFMVDITHIKDVELGDEVVLIGRQKNNVINVSSFTNATQLLNNEMLSRLPAAIPRTVIK
ncbi:alanine racemase [Cyclobacterium sp. 1_MG-2023]|uniref:alanine racemase n=1 Tax=Cyclobacterium sp. 1_MG-2023 TaxID=3062681 RepID=UPI0026E26A49|nr:alanine racemase [Cyclobacterium sp. 1_MG-2023]MDO6436828.1 alanine racemase [Cyclobacterium sp. 1_MG-2023]